MRQVDVWQQNAGDNQNKSKRKNGFAVRAPECEHGSPEFGGLALHFVRGGKKAADQIFFDFQQCKHFCFIKYLFL
jgi:hypothetical protein